MPEYRVYYFAGATDRVRHFQKFDARNDEFAIAIAADARGSGRVELCRGSELIKSWEALPGPEEV